MLALLWLKGLVRHRLGRLGGSAAGVALTVAFLASLGAFMASSSASMTRMAVSGVPVDWQVQLSPGSNPAAVAAALRRVAAPAALQQADYADAAGFAATTGGTTQLTGPGKVLGIGPGYLLAFPRELRPLLGTLHGVLVAQQTAANLHVSLGDTVTILRVGLPPATVRVSGIVDLPYADSLFQAVGVPPSAAAQAPPDNVLVVPAAQWHTLFDRQAFRHPDSVRFQLHVRLARRLPPDPESAFAYVQRLANHFEVQVAGSATVGDNLAARLDGVREDALYARVLFLFLGLPGAILAIALTLAASASGADSRRREQALVRTRGASTAQILQLAAAEGLGVSAAGVVLGLAVAALTARMVAPSSLLVSRTAGMWTAGAVLVGSGLGLASVVYPAWTQTRQLTVAAARAVVGRWRPPLWQKLHLDMLLLVVSVLAFWQAAGSGYQLVLAPEGVAQSSVHYDAFLGPACLWIGAVLLTMRLYGLALERSHAWLGMALRPLARGLATVVAAFVRRQRARLTQGVVLVALACSFATATAVFNTTYAAQSRVDAQLTNGADVTVTGSTAYPAASRLQQMDRLAGAAGITSMEHRFAYVGNDLQDLYGIDPGQIGKATYMSDAFFGNGNAQATLAALAARPDGILVSQETVHDYQLTPGDLLNLRLQSGRDHKYHVVPFHLVGVVREFPTAPRDSFLVANASYVAEQTGIPAREVVLMRAAGDPVQLAARARAVVGSLPGATVTDIGSTQAVIRSSLTAVSLRGLTSLELAFGVLLASAATGLVLGMALAERRRTFTILAALGADGRQLGSFVWSEGLLILVGGVAIGIAAGYSVAEMLVTVLKGVFDPPPQALSTPWLYMAVLVTAAAGSTVLAVLATISVSRRPSAEALRHA